jgi:hypothetical protein
LILTQALELPHNFFLAIWDQQHKHTKASLAAAMPKIRFVTKAHWLAYAKNEKGFSTVDYLGFLEAEDDSAIAKGSDRHDEISGFFTVLCYEAHAHGAAPSKWSRVEQRTQEFIMLNMMRYFQELTYCLGIWKIQKLCTLWYPNFVKKRCGEPQGTYPVEAQLLPAGCLRLVCLCSYSGSLLIHM